MRMIIFLALLAVLLIGCATLGETVRGITSDPTGYVSEAGEAARDVQKTVPELPYMFCVGIGYAAAFFRRWYKNFKIKQAFEKGLINPGKN